MCVRKDTEESKIIPRFLTWWKVEPKTGCVIWGEPRSTHVLSVWRKLLVIQAFISSIQADMEFVGKATALW